MFKKVVIGWTGLLMFGGLSVVNWSSQDSQQSVPMNRPLARYEVGTPRKSLKDPTSWIGAIKAGTDDCNEQTHYAREDWCGCVGLLVADFMTVEDVDRTLRTGRPSAHAVQLVTEMQTSCSKLHPRHWLESGNGWLGINWFRVLLSGLVFFAIGFVFDLLTGRALTRIYWKWQEQ